MPRTLISLGANLGNVRETMKLAQQMLQDEFEGGELRFSRLYRTPPVGGPDGQADFLNGIAALESDLDVWSIWESVKRVETGLGRHRLHRWEARRIDVDVLLHNVQIASDCDGKQASAGASAAATHNVSISQPVIRDAVIWTPHFKVPHPRMCMRSFMLIPALEVAAHWIEPVSGWTIRELATNLASKSPMVIATPNATLEEALRTRIKREDVLKSIRWIRLATPRDFELAVRNSSEWIGDSKLLIVATDIREPETVQWEDFSRDWACTLGMCRGEGTERVETGGEETESIVPVNLAKLGPRYLLPANDVDWASHEIISAFEALHCSIEVVLD